MDENSKANLALYVSELKDFVRFPSISAHTKLTKNIKECATWLAHHLKGIALKRVEIFVTSRHPIVYVESKQILHRPTVLIYGHYDVQPPDPLEEWHSPPFRPLVRGENLYGRGASDDKGQLFAHIKAIEIYLNTQGSLPVNVKCVFEGEEAIGSPSLPKFLSANKDKLKADVVVISDMRMGGVNRPAITYAIVVYLAWKSRLEGRRRTCIRGFSVVRCIILFRS